jgi:hypothetical protein
MKLAPHPGKGMNPYHHGKSTTRNTKLQERKFIAWDGEGVNLKGPGKPQSYVLFGSSVGHISNRGGLSAFDCLDHIIETGAEHPGAVHCGFAFSYDANMIIHSLSPVTLARLHRNGWVRLKKNNGDRYTITFAKGKFFRVTKYKPDYDAKHNTNAKTTVQIFDVWSFFATSFIKAYEKMIGPVDAVITTGKAQRGEFRIEDFDEIFTYWSLEIQMLRELAEELRRLVYNAGLRITQWHGPGALASYAMREHKIKEHKSEANSNIRLAARYAYAGGRFELYKIGRITERVYGYDINSAYPFAIAQLPSLSTGEWVYVTNPERISRFGVYHVTMKRGRGFMTTPGPLFHRDKEHNITFPWVTDGWYWSPEAYHAQRSGATVVEGWEFVGSADRPFSWVEDMYHQRRDWKQRGISAQVALKLCMNSMYGKLAQRVGWDPVTRRMPPFHQLEWAGWVTSHTRGRLFDIARRIPFDKLIAIETDGIYTTMPPKKLGIEHSETLGGWEISEYAEVMYVQSGLAWLQSPDGSWHEKRRGLDPCRLGHTPEECDCPAVFSLSACRDYLSSLHARPDRHSPWPVYSGQTTRFLGLGQALASVVPTHNRHCVWETAKRDISPGIGKRIHMKASCQACTNDVSAYEQAHDLVINSRAVLNPYSFPHAIPWEETEGTVKWRTEHDNDDMGLEGY